MISDIKNLTLQSVNLNTTIQEIDLDGFSESWNIHLYDKQFYYDALEGKRYQVDRQLKEFSEMKEDCRNYVLELNDKYLRVRNLFEEQ